MRDRLSRGGPSVVVGVVLVALGAWFLLRRFIPAIDADLVWPALLVLLGVVLVIASLRGPGGRGSS